MACIGISRTPDIPKGAALREPLSPTPDNLLQCFTPQPYLLESPEPSTAWSPGEHSSHHASPPPSGLARSQVVPVEAIAQRLLSIEAEARRVGGLQHFAPLNELQYDLEVFVSHIARCSGLGPVPFVAGLMFIERLLKVYPQAVPDPKAGLPQLYAAAVSLGMKAAEEYQSLVATVGGLSPDELRVGEVAILTALDWEVSVSRDEYQAMASTLA